MPRHVLVWLCLAALIGCAPLARPGGERAPPPPEGDGGLVQELPLASCEGEIHIPDTVADPIQLEGCDVISGNLIIEDRRLTRLVLPSLTVIEGDLRILDAPLVELDLSGLVRVEGDLALRDTPLPSLEGLDALREVHGQLGLFFNSELATLDGVEQLALSGCGVWIHENDRLSSLHGLTALRELGPCFPWAPELRVDGNDNLESLAGLSLTHAPLIALLGNERLVDIGALATVREANHAIHIEGNPLLSDLSPFGGLQPSTTTSSLHIANQPLVSSLEGLSSISEVNWLVVRGNATLGTLGLSGIERVAQGLGIDTNPRLCEAEVDSFLGRLASGPGLPEVLEVFENGEEADCP